MLQIEEVHIAIESGRREAHVIFEPVDAAHSLLMALALQVVGVLAGVEIVDVNVLGAVGGSEHVAAI